MTPDFTEMYKTYFVDKLPFVFERIVKLSMTQNSRLLKTTI